jgi:thiamine-phosphate pyrophosphorylase
VFDSPLYPIIDVDLCEMRGLNPRALAQAFLSGGARVIQVRQKSAGSASLLALTRDILEIATSHKARIILNDRSDLARIAGAHGVHVGQTDLDPSEVKSIAGFDLTVGLSTHTPAQVDAAAAGAADYIAVGPVFLTRTKDTGYEPRGLDLVRYAATKGKPVVAIGGITLGNARQALEAGASAVALISDLISTSAPSVRVREYLEACA